MKKTLALLIFLIFISAHLVFSLDLKILGGLGNIAYDSGNTSFLSDEDNPGTFSTHYFPLILLELSGEYNGLGYCFGYERNPLIRNRIFANISLEQEYFIIDLGPFFGFLNSEKLPVNPGVQGSIKLMLPGIVFIQASGSSTLAAIPMEKEGNYSQISADLSAGFWVPYVIGSLNMSIRNFTLREKTALLIEDELYRYYFRADVFTKNYGYTIKVDLGYQNLIRSYSSLRVSGGEIVKDLEKDEFKSLFMGLEGTFSISHWFKLILAGEMPIYCWSVRPMKDPKKNTHFFEMRAGFILTLPW